MLGGIGGVFRGTPMEVFCVALVWSMCDTCTGRFLFVFGLLATTVSGRSFHPGIVDGAF